MLVEFEGSISAAANLQTLQAGTPRLVQSKTATSTAVTSANSVTLDTPATAGNLLVYLVAGDKNTGAMTLSGWTSAAELTSTSVGLYFRYKVAAGGETTVNGTTANNSASGNTVWIGEYDDPAAGGFPWGVAGSATNITDETSVTTKGTGTTGTLTHAGLAIAVAAIDSANGSPTYSWSNSYSTRFSTGTGTTGVGQMSVAEKAVTAGSTTTTTLTQTGNADQISAVVVVIASQSVAYPVRGRGLDGSAPAASGATGDLDGGSVAFAGSAPAASGATGALDRTLAQAGSAAAASGATGALAAARPLAASGTAAADVTGDLARTLVLAGSSPAANGATGDLNIAGQTAFVGRLSVTAAAVEGPNGAEVTDLRVVLVGS